MKLKPVSLALFALGLAIGAAAIDHARADQFAVDSGKIGVWMWNQTNAYRQANGVPRLIIGPTIVPIAQEYAEFLARNNMSGHTADGRDPGQRVAARGIKNFGVWENVSEYLVGARYHFMGNGRREGHGALEAVPWSPGEPSQSPGHSRGHRRRRVDP